MDASQRASDYRGGGGVTLETVGRWSLGVFADVLAVGSSRNVGNHTNNRVGLQVNNLFLSFALVAIFL
eukprot:scaffold600_cov189-Amphora_coffeaeformis.AAC.2